MNTRLTRPLLAAVIGGALLAGGAVFTAPATAAPSTATDPTASPSVTPSDTTSPTPEPTDTTTTPTPEPSDTTTTSPTPEPPENTTSPSPTPSGTTTSPTPDPTTSSPTPDPTTTTTPPPPNKAPAGSFTLNTRALWIGQAVQLTTTPVVDENPATAIREIYWGDGTVTKLTADGVAAKRYLKAGVYKIRYAVRDEHGALTSAAPQAISVAVPGRQSLSKSVIYQGQRFYVNISNVPAGTSRINLVWGDGYSQALRPRAQSVPSTILTNPAGRRLSGTFTVAVQYVNKYGASSWIRAGQIRVLADNWRPTVTIKKPASSNRLKSWKYVTGTAADKGSGVAGVYVGLVQVSGSKLYCTNRYGKFQRFTEYNYNAICDTVFVRVVKGKWTYRVPTGLKKGTLFVDAISFDQSLLYSKWASREVKITRS